MLLNFLRLGNIVVCKIKIAEKYISDFHATKISQRKTLVWPVLSRKIILIQSYILGYTISFPQKVSKNLFIDILTFGIQLRITLQNCNLKFITIYRAFLRTFIRYWLKYSCKSSLFRVGSTSRTVWCCESTNRHWNFSPTFPRNSSIATVGGNTVGFGDFIYFIIRVTILAET